MNLMVEEREIIGEGERGRCEMTNEDMEGTEAFEI